MRKFEYRSARFKTEIPVIYTDGTFESSGMCTQVSHDGIEVNLVDRPQAGNDGRISLRLDGRSLDVAVHVAHANQDRCGMQFVYNSDREKKAISELIALARRQTGLPLKL